MPKRPWINTIPSWLWISLVNPLSPGFSCNSPSSFSSLLPFDGSENPPATLSIYARNGKAVMPSDASYISVQEAKAEVLTWPFEWWVNNPLWMEAPAIHIYPFQVTTSWEQHSHFKKLWYYWHRALYIFIVMLLCYYNRMSGCGKSLSKLVVSDWWCNPITICHHPLCFPVVFPEEGINQVLCHHLLTEPGRLAHNRPHCSFRLPQINTIIDLGCAHTTFCPWLELWRL